MAGLNLAHLAFHDSPDDSTVGTVNHKAQTSLHKLVIQVLKPLFQGQNTLTTSLFRQGNHVLNQHFFPKIRNFESLSHNLEGVNNIL